MKLSFDTNGNQKQKECVRYWTDHSTTDIVYGGSKGSSKSYTGCQLIFGDALMYPGTHYFIARKELKDLRNYTIPSIHEVFEHWKIPIDKYTVFNGQDNFFRLYNKSTVVLLAAKYLPGDPLYMRFGSMQMTRGWIEEAGEFEEDAKNSLAASIGRWKNDLYNLHPKLLQTCNPTKNYLYREYYQKFKNGTLEPHKKFIQAYPTDNKMLDTHYLQNLENSLSANQKERLLKGNWEYDDDPSALISYDAIMDYWNPIHVERNGNIFITADIARKGKDKTVVRVWDGLLCVDRAELKVSTVTESVELIQKKAKQYNVPRSKIIADEDGVGGGVVDYIKCKGFVNNSRPLKDENYGNLKDQCSFWAAQLVEERKIGELCDNNNVIQITTEEMEQVKQADLDTDGKRRVIKKDVVKQLIGRSPDEWDSIMMRMYFYIKGDSQGKYVILGA